MFDAKNTLFATVFSYYFIFGLFPFFNNKKLAPKRQKRNTLDLTLFTFSGRASIIKAPCLGASVFKVRSRVMNTAVAAR